MYVLIQRLRIFGYGETKKANVGFIKSLCSKSTGANEPWHQSKWYKNKSVPHQQNIKSIETHTPFIDLVLLL